MAGRERQDTERRDENLVPPLSALGSVRTTTTSSTRPSARRRFMTERTVNCTERLHNVIYAIATLLVIGLIAVLMSGCASSVPIQFNGGTEEAYRRDRYRCTQESSQRVLLHPSEFAPAAEAAAHL